MKRKVNRSKRARVGSHGFKVYKNTYVYIAKPTEGGWSKGGKPAPRSEIVERVKELFNTEKSIRKMVKHIKGITIKYSTNPKRGGRWDGDKQWFELIDYKWFQIENVDQVVYHELVGHAFWQWARKWRPEEFEEFNKLAHDTPPVNDYVAKYLDKKSEYHNESIYENEQHSAITELMKIGGSYVTRKGNIANDEQIEKLKKAWERLHY